MIDDHNIPKPFEPIGIEDFTGEDRPDLRSQGGLDLNPVLTSFLKEADHIPVDRRDQLPFAHFRFRFSISRCFLLPFQLVNKDLKFFRPFFQLTNDLLIDYFLTLNGLQQGAFCRLDFFDLFPLLFHFRDGMLPLGLFIPITAGKGPVPAGRITREISVSVRPFFDTVTVSVSRE